MDLSHRSRRPVWLVIEDEPTVALWHDAGAAISHGQPMGWPLLSSISPIRAPLVRPGLGDGEAPNVSVTLHDAQGTLARYWREAPPVRRRARILTQDGPLFEGIVTGYSSVGPTTQVLLQGGAAWALTDVLPLRTSAVWGQWSRVRALPLVYGRASVEPIPYDRDGRVFLVADHPIVAVERVIRDDAPSDAWTMYHGPDSTGHVCAWIELATPLAPGERLRADVLGKRSHVSGALLHEPHEILLDLLTQVCGLPIDPGAMQRLCTEYAGWQIGVAYTSDGITQRQAIDRICGSIGAAWSLSACDFARRWPPEADAPIASVGSDVSAVSASASHTDIATVVRVLYDVGDHDGQPRRAVQVAAPQAISRYGRIIYTWEAACLREMHQAHDVALRILGWMARARWTLCWSMPDDGLLRIGDTVCVAHPNLPVHDDMVLADVQRDPMRASLQCEAQIAVGPPPQMVIEHQSSQFDPVIRAGAAVEYRDGSATFTLLGERGEPLCGAKVILDGATVRYANAAGQVSFQTSRGLHRLHVQADGYAPMDIEIDV